MDLSKHCPMCGGPLALYATPIEDGTHNGLPDPLLLCTCEILTLQDIQYHSYTTFIEGATPCPPSQNTP